MSRRDKLKKLRDDIDATKKTTERLLFYSDLSKEDKDSLLSVYDEWATGKAYKAGDLVRYEGELYEVIQPHTSQADRIPASTPALFTVATPKGDGTQEIIPDFRQPTGAHDAYKEGAKVRFGGKVYESRIDNNAYSPADYPKGWREIN